MRNASVSACRADLLEQYAPANGVATRPTMLPTFASVALPFFVTAARRSGRNFAVTITGEMTFVS